MTDELVRVPLNQLPTRQLVLVLLEQQNIHYKRLDRIMTDLTAAVEDLKASVTGASERVATQIQGLNQNLADAQQRLSTLQVQDDADKAALTAALSDAQTAASAIEGEATQLGTLGGTPATPATPADPSAPADPAPTDNPTPVNPNAPADPSAPSADPSAPTDPTNPANPTDPAAPSNPSADPSAPA